MKEIKRSTTISAVKEIKRGTIISAVKEIKWNTTIPFASFLFVSLAFFLILTLPKLMAHVKFTIQEKEN